MASIKTIFTNIANAIRTKKGTSDKYLPENMAEEISTIETGIMPSGKIEITNTEEINVTNYATAQVVDSNLLAENIKEGVSILGKVGTFKGGGDTTQEDGLITREETSYTNDRVTKVGSYVFYNNKTLTSVSFPQVTSIGYNAFNKCSKLTSVSFPQATSISSNAFDSCSNLTSVSFPNVTDISQSAFNNCRALISANFQKATNIGWFAFQECYSLVKLVITQTDNICNLNNTNAFNNCYHFLGITNSNFNPNGDKDGRIYVPDSLVDRYKSATNWSAYADIIVPLSTLVE